MYDSYDVCMINRMYVMYHNIIYSMYVLHVMYYYILLYMATYIFNLYILKLYVSFQIYRTGIIIYMCVHKVEQLRCVMVNLRRQVYRLH